MKEELDNSTPIIDDPDLPDQLKRINQTCEILNRLVAELKMFDTFLSDKNDIKQTTLRFIKRIQHESMNQIEETMLNGQPLYEDSLYAMMIENVKIQMAQYKQIRDDSQYWSQDEMENLY